MANKFYLDIFACIFSKLYFFNNIGRNPKCDRDWIKVQRKKGTGNKREIKVQWEKGKYKSYEKGEIKVQIEIGKSKGSVKKKKSHS